MAYNSLVNEHKTTRTKIQQLQRQLYNKDKLIDELCKSTIVKHENSFFNQHLE